MPLYNIPLPKKGGNYTNAELHDIWINVRFDYRKWQGSKMPAFYVSRRVLLVLMDSEDFKLFNINYKTNKVGTYDGGTVYVSPNLVDNEYYIGIEETEILHLKRKLKINKLKNECTKPF